MMSSKIILVLQGAPSGCWHWSALVVTGRWGSRERGSLWETEGDWGPNTTNIFANCATCSWETLTMLSPQLVAGEHGLFGAMSTSHESEDIQIIFFKSIDAAPKENF